MNQINPDAKNRDAILQKHRPADNDLVEDLSCLVTCPKPYVSHLIASRTKEDKAELERILQHLPMVRDAKEQRQAARPSQTLAGAGAQCLLQPSPRGDQERHAAHAAAHIGSKPAQLRAAGKPASPRPKVNGNIGETIKQATPQATPRGMKFLGPPGLAVERPNVALNALSVLEAQSDEDRRKDEDVRRKEEKAAREVTERVEKKLAEIGVDPHGMKAGEVLKMYYARGCGSAYYFANQAIENKAIASQAGSSSDGRAITPQTFKELFTEQANIEIKRAKEVPMTDIHRCLDHWEINFLADQCRSLKHFGEKSRGHTSEYKRAICSRFEDKSYLFKPPEEDE